MAEKLSARARRVVEVCSAGGFARYALERHWHGGEKFAMRVYDAEHRKVPGLGYAAVHEALKAGYLTDRPCVRSSAWPTEWASSGKQL